MSVISAQQAVGINISNRIKNKIVANENIAQYKIATSHGYVANSADLTHIDKIAGIAVEAITSGTSGYVISEGEIENSSWSWTSGQVLYLNGTSISVTPPSTGFRVIVGTAINSIKVLIKISESIMF